MKKRGFLCSIGEYSQSLKHFAVCFHDCNCQTKLNRYVKARLLYLKQWLVACVWESTALAWIPSAGCLTRQRWVSDGPRPRRPLSNNQFVLQRAAQQMSFRENNAAERLCAGWNCCNFDHFCPAHQSGIVLYTNITLYPSKPFKLRIAEECYWIQSSYRWVNERREIVFFS